MCGRFTLRASTQQIVDQFRLTTMPEWQPRYNIAPTQQVPIVRPAEKRHSRQLTFARWGLIPSWAKEASIGNRMINARAETLAEKPSFRAAFKVRRCLVVADGYYEWQPIDGAKQPFYIHLDDHGLLGFAGLWESWPGPTGATPSDPLESCTIITTAAIEFTSHIHVRMPVLLQPEDYDRWLDPELQPSEGLWDLLQPYAADDLVADTVSTHVNSPKHEDAQCVEPVSD